MNEQKCARCGGERYLHLVNAKTLTYYTVPCPGCNVSEYEVGLAEQPATAPMNDNPNWQPSDELDAHDFAELDFASDYRALYEDYKDRLKQAEREIETLRSTLAALQNEAAWRAHSIKAFLEMLPLKAEEDVPMHVIIDSSYRAWEQAHQLEGYVENMRKGQPE